MSTTYVNTIDSLPLYADRAEKDAAGNTITTTYATKTEVKTGLASKQDTISDLATIRSGAAKGETALQDYDVALVATTGNYDNLLNKPTIPSGTQLVPAATSADADKVLTVDAQGIPGWAAGGSGGGNVFMATSTTTFPELWQAFYEEGKIVYCTSGSASSLKTPYFLQTLKADDSSHITGTATFVQFNRYSTGRIEVYHSTVRFNSNHSTLGTVTFSRQTIVPDYPQNHAGEFLTAQSSGSMAFASVNQVPASTSADADKVLTVDSQGTPAWATPPGGSVTDVEVDGTSVVNASGVAEITMPTVPALKALTAGNNITITESANSVTIAATVADVPAVTSSDDGKVLKATYSGGSGSYAWSADTYATKTEVKTGLASKQDTISDLATIRSGAAKGATALQDYDVSRVALTGSYTDLLNTPTIPTATSDLTNDSGFITLSDVPAQVNADWNSSSGASEILNKPTPKTLTAGTGISITENSSTITIASSITPATVDQTYSASSTNAQSGTAVAGALATLGTWEDVSTEAQYNTTIVLAGGFKIKYNAMLNLVSVTADVNLDAGAANIFTWSNRLKPVATAFALGNGMSLYVSQTSLNQPAAATNRWVNGVWMWPVVGE